MRRQVKFSEFGNICQETVVGPGKIAEVFDLKIPKNHVGFLYYLANDFSPLKLNIDGEEFDIGIIAPINSPKLFNPPFLIKEFIKATAYNPTEESKKITFYTDGIAYSVLTISEETLINEVKGQKSLRSQETIELPINVKEIIPTSAHIINHNLHIANNWYEIKLPRDAVTWQVRARGNHEIRYSYSPTHQTYMTLASGDVLSADVAPNSDINAIYIMSEEAGIVVELEVWQK